MNFSPRFTITNRTTKALTRIERARGFLEAAKLSAEWIGAMQARALILEAHHTTHIEGSQLTLEQSERVLAGQPVPEAGPKEARKGLNYHQGLKVLKDYDESGQPAPNG